MAHSLTPTMNYLGADFCFVSSHTLELGGMFDGSTYNKLEDVPPQKWRSASSLCVRKPPLWSKMKEYLLMNSCRVEALMIGPDMIWPVEGRMDWKDDAFWSTLADPACSLTCLSLWGFEVRSEDVALLSKFLVTRHQTSRLRFLRLEFWISEESCRLIAEALGSPTCRLLGLSLQIHPAGLRHLGTALVQPECNLRCLGLEVGNANQQIEWSSEWVEKFLRNPACCLLDLRWQGLSFPEKFPGGEGLECAPGRLERLDLYREATVGEGRRFFRRDFTNKLNFCHKLKEVGVYCEDIWIVLRALQRPDSILEVARVYDDHRFDVELAHQVLAQALLSKHCRLKCLELHSLDHDSIGEYILTQIAHALRSKDSKLESLHFLNFPSFSQPCGKILVDALEHNVRLCSLKAPLPFNIQSRALNLLTRNRLLKEGELLQQPQVMPHSARLFLCGHERVGKTTIRKQLYYLVDKRIRNPLHKPQEEPPTRGMELQSLALGKNKLMLCDLAGHKEYHVFHHFFISGSDRDLFLVVCKADDTPHQQEFMIKLRYWLRFIASHRTPGKRSPKVIIVLNFFSSRYKKKVMTSIANDSTETLMEEYAKVLDFSAQREMNVFGIDAHKIHYFSPIFQRLEDLVTELLDSRSSIPKICDDIISIISPSRRNMLPFLKPKKLFLPFSHLVRKYAEKFCSDNTETNVDARHFHAALVELHNAGQIIFFPSHDEQDSVDQIVIADCEWFCCNLIGILMQPEEIFEDGQRNLAEPGVWLREDVRKILLQQDCKAEYVDDVLKYLHRLELFYPVQDDEISHTVPPSKLMFPSLLPEIQQLQWLECEDKAIIFGRRLECQDKAKTLLPAGAFARLQVKLHKEFGNMSWRVGCGWVSFMENCVATIVRFGGETNRWEDRQWVDIMVRYPKLPLEQHESTAENIVRSVKNQLFTICQGIDRGIPAVSLQECVMSNGLVRDLESVSMDVVLLDTLKEEVRKKGIRYNLTWSQNRSTPILDLFLPSELRELASQDVNALSKIAQEFHTPDCSDTDSPPPLYDKDDSCETSTDANLSEDMRLLFQLIKREHKMIYDRLDKQDKMLFDIFEGVSHIRNDMELLLKKLEHEESNILSSCSYQLVKDLLTGPLPAFPFLTDREGVWQQMKNLVGKEVELQFMCEWHAGAHEVEGQKGVLVKLSTPDWLVRAGPILVPALKVICCAARLAASVVLPGSHVFVPSFESLSAFGLSGEDLQHEILPEILKSFVDGVPDLEELTSRQPPVDKSRLRDFLFDLTQGKDIDMGRDFQLYRVEVPLKKRISWVCRDHSRGLQRVKSQNPF